MTPEAAQLIDYIVKEVIRRPGTQIDERTPLVSSGLIDSMSLIEILLKLESVMHSRIPPGKVQAKDMDTVDLMVATAQRVGKPRN
jgi:acyl carrier protein